MVQKLASEGLTKLCSNEQLQLLNAIDSLRSQGIDRYISLPQIIVCGDQSSGKSSVLEAISGVSFPIKSSLCTRFPTEIVLRKTADPSVNVSIIPHHTRSEADQDSLARFHAKLDSFSGLPGLIDDAKDAMGIAEFGKTFSKDRLRVEISGPDRPHLTIVDLPGLIHSETKYQSAEDVDLIRSMVQDYMDKPRTIILAVVSAKNDYPNQIVLKLARRADPRGLRTIGVITKPDDLAPGSGNEKSFIALASNQDIHFRLGWHVLRNVDSDRNECPLSERDKQEAAFFSTGSWVDLDQSILGIDKLRSRLSEVLTQQIADELPALIEEIDTQISSCQRRLGHLGKPRSTQSEQTLYLIEISQEFQTVVKEACDGAYNHSFFGDAMTSSGAAKRYRAVIQKLNRDFAVDIGRNGRRREVTPTTRDSFLRDIIVRMTRTQGRELPGMFNPTIVTDLFKEQASPWRGRVESSLEEIRGASEAFLRHVITHIADESSYLVILKHIVEPRFEHIMSAVRQETNKLLEHIQSQHLITYNQLFFPKLQSIRAEREKSRYTEIIEQRNGLGYYSKATELSSALLEWTHEDMERSAASGALDYLEAYYEISLSRFIDDFAIQIVEANLVSELPKIFTPLAVVKMSEQDVSRVAGETEESKTARHDLESKLKILSCGAITCKSFFKFHHADLNSNDHEEANDFTTLQNRQQPDPHTDSDTESVNPRITPVEAGFEMAMEVPVEEPKVFPEVIPEPPAEPSPGLSTWGDSAWGTPAGKKKKKGKKVVSGHSWA